MKGVCGGSHWAINQRPVLSKYGCALRIERENTLLRQGSRENRSVIERQCDLEPLQ